MTLHSKYTEYRIIYKDKYTKRLEHIKDPNRIIKIEYYESGGIRAEIWFLNNKWHREDGPAYINYYESGQIKEEYWYLNDKWHREDGPAEIWYYKSSKIKHKRWCLNNKYHREDGPARIWFNKSGKITCQEFYLNDIKYIYDNFIQTPGYQVYLKQQSITIFD